ncbi:hypothetical protein EMIT048CA2_20164 [Pseudomonas chlororaphis]
MRGSARHLHHFYPLPRETLPLFGQLHDAPNQRLWLLSDRLGSDNSMLTVYLARGRIHDSGTASS